MAGSTIAALPQPLMEHALRLAGGMWAEAVANAGAQHAAIETAWREEQAHQVQEIDELVRDLDAANRLAADASERAAAELSEALTEAKEGKPPLLRQSHGWRQHKPATRMKPKP